MPHDGALHQPGCQRLFLKQPKMEKQLNLFCLKEHHCAKEHYCVPIMSMVEVIAMRKDYFCWWCCFKFFALLQSWCGFKSKYLKRFEQINNHWKTVESFDLCSKLGPIVKNISLACVGEDSWLSTLDPSPSVQQFGMASTKTSYSCRALADVKICLKAITTY